MWFALTLSLLSVVGYSYISILIGKITQKHVSYILYNTAIEKYDVSFVTLISSTQPVITALLAYFFFKERLTWLQRIGILMTVIGSILFVLR